MGMNAVRANSTRKRRDLIRSGSIQTVVLAIFCGLFLAAGLLARWVPFLDQGMTEFASGTLLKVGVVLLVAWLAAPQLEKLGWQRLRGSALVGLLIVAVAFAIRPRLGAIVGIVFFVAALFFGIVGWLRKKSGTLR
jgi:uncharacterized membrane protein YadS